MFYPNVLFPLILMHCTLSPASALFLPLLNIMCHSFYPYEMGSASNNPQINLSPAPCYPGLLLANPPCPPPLRPKPK